MEHLDYLKIIEKIGVEKDLSRLTEEELLFYDMVKAIKCRSADDERIIIQQAIRMMMQVDSKRRQKPTVMSSLMLTMEPIKKVFSLAKQMEMEKSRPIPTIREMRQLLRSIL